MSDFDKLYFLRMGGNNEKSYILKTINFFSGLLVRANYYEMASGLLSGLFLQLNTLKKPKSFVIDPVSYAFGLDPYSSGSIRAWHKIKIEKADEKIRNDLKMSCDDVIPDSWKRDINDPDYNKKRKIEILGMKTAYRKLADIYYPANLAKEIGRRALEPNDFSASNILDDHVQRVINYQLQALEKRYDVGKYEEFEHCITKPFFILSPYYLISNNSWYVFNKAIWNCFEDFYKQDNATLVFLSTIDFLNNNIDDIVNTLSKTNSDTIMFWIDKFEECNDTQRNLDAYIKFIKILSDRGKNLINLYSGGLSPYILPFGLNGLVDGPGYGMDRDVKPIRGGVPTAKYYIPTLHLRVPVAEAYDYIFRTNSINSKNDFYKYICSCPICKKGIVDNLGGFSRFFGELGPPKLDKRGVQRRYPTPEAIERCNYHFILSRLIQYKLSLKIGKSDILNLLEDEKNLWKEKNLHLINWKSILSKYTN